MKVLKITTGSEVSFEDVKYVTHINPLVAGDGNWAEFYKIPGTELFLAIDELPGAGTPFNWEGTRIVSEVSGEPTVRLFGTVVLFAEDRDVELSDLPERVAEALKVKA